MNSQVKGNAAAASAMQIDFFDVCKAEPQALDASDTELKEPPLPVPAALELDNNMGNLSPEPKPMQENQWHQPGRPRKDSAYILAVIKIVLQWYMHCLCS